MNYFNELTIGVCYYPEHWDKQLWKDDLNRMQNAGIQVIRIAEFAWNKIEIREGIYDYTFFDNFLDLVEETPLKVIFCTPTATPPAWLTEKYPEVLCVDHDGSQHKHGMRRQYNYNSPIYLQKTTGIVTATAKHYGQRRCIIGWQIDNELNCVTDEFYSESDHIAFRQYVQDKYKSMAAVNEAWGTVFWNQEYSAWDEIFLPRHAPRSTANPHLRLDAVRFFADSAGRYCQLQSAILRQYIPEDVFITTNGIFKHIDYKQMVTDSLDFLTYDSYPTFGLMDRENAFGDRKWSMNLTRVRASSKLFGIMEQQAGPGGWVNFHKAVTPKPGQIRLWTYQSIAHGADFVSYFRWRTCTYGTELYWYGILGHDNQDNRRLLEVKQITGEMPLLKEIAGAYYQADVAVLYDYDNEWDAEYDAWLRPLHQYSGTNWFQALQKAHTPYDYLTISEETDVSELQQYSCIVLPHMALIKEHVVRQLKEYVQQGGTVIAGARTGYKDELGRCPMMPEPVSMNDLFGITIDDFTLLREGDPGRFAHWGDQQVEMNLCHDILTPIAETCQVRAVYSDDYYQGQPAITENRYGKGRAIYTGAAFSMQTVQALLDYLGLSEPYQPELRIPEACELAVRENADSRYVFLLNYSSQEQSIECTRPWQELLTQTEITGHKVIKPYDVLILKEKRKKV